MVVLVFYDTDYVTSPFGILGANDTPRFRFLCHPPMELEMTESASVRLEFLFSDSLENSDSLGVF